MKPIISPFVSPFLKLLCFLLYLEEGVVPVTVRSDKLLTLSKGKLPPQVPLNLVIYFAQPFILWLREQ